MARVRRTDRGTLRLTGADRATWLQGLVTNDVLALQSGCRLYSAWLTPQGRMITDLWIVPAANALLLDVPAPLAASLSSTLDGLVFAEDVQIDDVSAAMVCTQVVGMTGPGAEAGVRSARADDGVLVADDTYGRPGLVAYGDVTSLIETHGLEALDGAPWVDLDTFDVFRIEAGVPRFLVDMTEDTIPLEAGIEDRAISFTKGCYVGQEIIVRVTTRGGGRVARRLVGLTVDVPGSRGEAASPGPESAPGTHAVTRPAPGAALHAGERRVGHLTSVAWSPRLGRVIAMGYVHRDFVNPGTRVEVRHGEPPLSAIVTALPFVAPAG